MIVTKQSIKELAWYLVFYLSSQKIKDLIQILELFPKDFIESLKNELAKVEIKK